MSINFSTLQGLTIPEGVVTKIESGGVVLWTRLTEESVSIVLEVAKVTSNTYVGSTSYTGEEFILLDVYPKSGGTVNVTYGGLTKTVKDTSGAEEPNAIQVFFGTFGGVSDEVTTSASGTLTITGQCRGVGPSGYKKENKGSTVYPACIKGIVDFGEIEIIPINFSAGFLGLTLSELPDSIVSIGDSAFVGCSGLTLSKLPDSIVSIGDSAFKNCSNIALNVIPEGVTSIGASAFSMLSAGNSDLSGAITKITDIVLPSTLQSIGINAFSYPYDGGSGVKNRLYLTTLTILATTPPNLPDGSLSEVGGVGWDYILKSIIVPVGCGEAYKTTEGWSKYADYIVEAS